LIEIIPAILTDTSTRFKELVRKIEPYTSRIHVDVADGEFVSNLTVKGYNEIKETESAVKFDVHLMVKRPQDLMKEWYYTYADRFIIHAESEVVLADIIKVIQEHGRKVGLALNPETQVEKIEPYLLRSVRSSASRRSRNKTSENKTISGIDFVQFMTVHPGFQGGKFINEVIDHISLFHNKYPDIIIMCDGGITPETAPKLVKAGATVLVSGSYVVRSPDMGKAIEELKIVTSIQ